MTDKQALAFHYLTDKQTTEVLFGGAGGGGKTFLGCGYIIYLSLKYRDIRCCIAREELKSLKESTLLTFFQICKMWGMVAGEDYTYNQNDGVITFKRTGSAVYLKELKYYPSDPDYDYLGSTEYTATFIDEASQVTQRAKNVLRSRIRYKLKEYGLIPKQLLTCNPHKGYLYADYYLPSKRGTLPEHMKFVQALPNENPELDQSYIENLRSLDAQTRERLLYGNWEYDDDPSTLCDFDAISDMFTNVLPISQQKFIIADIARFGDDRTVISYWEGWDCKKISAYKKLPTVPDPNNPKIESSASVIQKLRHEKGVPLSHVLVDEDGVGGGVKDSLGCRGFQGGRSPFKSENYLNLRAQCYFHLARKINKREIAVRTTNSKLKELLTEECGFIKAHHRDNDKKLQITPKDLIKKHLGRSPDIADTLMMRSYFDFLPVAKVQTITIR